MRDLQEFNEKCKALLEAGSCDDIIRESLERLDSHPDDLEALLFLAEAKLLKGNTSEAKSLLDPLCRRVIKLSWAFKLLGDSCREHNPSLARDYYEKYIAFDPDSDESFKIKEQLDSELHGGEDELNTGFRTLTMADLMIKQGHLENAGEILEEILDREPDNQQVLERISKVKVIKELEKWRKALAQARKND